jgi:hypothetical protein
MRLLVRVVSLALLSLCVACSSDGSASTGSDPTTGTSPEASAHASTIVGTWQRTELCGELVADLNAAGLADAVPEWVAGSELIPGVVNDPSRIDPSDPCKGAVPRKHSHFFRSRGGDGEEGELGSLDYAGTQVDDGTFQLVDSTTLQINDDTFTYRISDDGQTLSLNPVRATPYAIAVACPGSTWQRAS